MQNKRLLIEALLSRKRVNITPHNYFSCLKYCFIAFFLFVLSSSVLILFHYGITFTTLGICIGTITLSIVVILSIAKRTKFIAVKGDALIINSMSTISCVTSLRSIVIVKTSSFLGIQLTKLTYKLDGVSKRAMFYSVSSTTPFRPEKSIRKAIELSKKQRQTISRVL